MNKLVKVLAVSGMSLGILGGTVVPMTAQAAKAAKIVKTRQMKKHGYKLNGGYMYTSAQLTKKAVKASKHPKMVFYSVQSATVIKRNGKKAIYYYLKNKSGSVQGWIWRGNVTKQPTYTQQKKDIANVLAILHGMSADVQNHTLGYFVHMDYKTAYHNGESGRDLSNVMYWTADLVDGQSTADINGTIKLYNLFKDRVDKSSRKELINEYYTLDDHLNDRNGYDHTEDGVYDDLNDILSTLSETIGEDFTN